MNDLDYEGLNLNNLEYSNKNKLRIFNFFNWFLDHRYMSIPMLVDVITTSVKNKFGHLGRNLNYGEVVSSVLLKLFED